MVCDVKNLIFVILPNVFEKIFKCNKGHGFEITRWCLQLVSCASQNQKRSWLCVSFFEYYIHTLMHSSKNKSDVVDGFEFLICNRKVLGLIFLEPFLICRFFLDEILNLLYLKTCQSRKQTQTCLNKPMTFVTIEQKELSINENRCLQSFIIMWWQICLHIAQSFDLKTYH